MKIFVADREAGNIIEEVRTIKKGLEMIEEYEREDKKEGNYTPNFYNLVDENLENININ